MTAVPSQCTDHPPAGSRGRGALALQAPRELPGIAAAAPRGAAPEGRVPLGHGQLGARAARRAGTGRDATGRDGRGSSALHD